MLVQIQQNAFFLAPTEKWGSHLRLKLREVGGSIPSRRTLFLMKLIPQIHYSALVPRYYTKFFHISELQHIGRENVFL